MAAHKEPLVSVIIPAFNSGSHLARAIKSVLDQDYKNIQCIVINDGSSDNTEAIAQSFNESITYIYQNNSGAASARNNGISIASGEYIAFLDADDYWTTSKIKLQVQAFIENPECVLFSTNRARHNTNTEIQKETSAQHEFNNRKIRIFSNFEDLFKNPYLTTSTVMVKASRLKEIGGFDTTLITAEDLDLYFRCCWKHDFGKISETLVYKDELEESLGNKTRSYRDNIYVIDKFIKENPDFAKNSADLIHDRKEYIYTRWIQHLIYIGEGIEARNVILKSLQDGKPSTYKALFIKSYFSKPINYLKKIFK
jgi:glycosyltransferase involved in cell wall biosynthesis